MKKIFSFILLATITLSSLAGGLAAPPGMPPMSEADLEAFVNMIESLPPEVKDELTKTGEEIIKRAEALGEDPFELIARAAEDEKDVFSYTDELLPEDYDADFEKPSLMEPEQEKKEVPNIDITKLASTRQLLENIIDALQSFKEKSVGDKQKRETLKMYQFVIDDLIYYLELLNNNTMLTLLQKNEFEKLRLDLKAFHDELIDLESQLIVKELGLEGSNPYEQLGIPRTATHEEIVRAYQKKADSLDLNKHEKQLKAEDKSQEHIRSVLADLQKEFKTVNTAYALIRDAKMHEHLFNEVLRTLSTAADTRKIVEEAEKLIAKYDPEAAQLKKAQDELEKKAREEQKKSRSRIHVSDYTPFKMPAPFNTPILDNYDDDFGGGYDSPFDFDPFGGDKSSPTPVSFVDDGLDKKDGKGKGDARKPTDIKKSGGKDAAAAPGKKPKAKPDAKPGLPEKVKTTFDILNYEIDNKLKKPFADLLKPEKEMTDEAIHKRDLLKPGKMVEVVKADYKDQNAKDAGIYLTELQRVDKAIGDIKRQIKDALEKKVKEEEKKHFKEAVIKLFDEFKKSDAYKKVGSTILESSHGKLANTWSSMAGYANIKPEYQALFWGDHAELEKEMKTLLKKIAQKDAALKKAADDGDEIKRSRLDREQKSLGKQFAVKEAALKKNQPPKNLVKEIHEGFEKLAKVDVIDPKG